MVMGRSTQVEAAGNDDRRDKGRWRCISAFGMVETAVPLW